MKSRTVLQLVVITLMLMWGLAGPGLANPLPAEPSDGSLIHEDVDYVVGLYFREYSVAGNGVVDYRTARQIRSTEPGDYHTMVIEAREFPLCYWYDDNQDGRFEMRVDRNVEGCACDIVRYDPATSR